MGESGGESSGPAVASDVADFCRKLRDVAFLKPFGGAWGTCSTLLFPTPMGGVSGSVGVSVGETILLLEPEADSILSLSMLLFVCVDWS